MTALTWIKHPAIQRFDPRQRTAGRPMRLDSKSPGGGQFWSVQPVPSLTFARASNYLWRMNGLGAPRPKKASALGTIALVVVLLGLLVAATVLAIRTWTSVQGPPMPGVGYMAMTIGVVFSILIGIALMALLFYSSRYGYDERASRDYRIDGDGEQE